MRKTWKKITALILVTALLVTLTSVLSACAKKKSSDTAERNSAAYSVKTSVLGAMNPEWTPTLDDGALAQRSDGGDYIIALGWTEFFCDLLRDSSLQTGKLKITAQVLESEEGKALMTDFTSNAGDIIPLLKKVGFTSVDISELIYKGLSKLVKDGKSVVSGCTARLNSVKLITDSYPEALANLNKALSNMDDARQNLNFTDEETEDMLKVFDDAKGATESLVSFAYTIGVGAVTDNLFANIFGTEGALGNISNSEIKTYVKTLADSCTALKNALNEEQLAKLNSALEVIVRRFDNAARSSVIISEVVKYAKYANLAVDVLPDLCGIAAVGSGAIGTGAAGDEILNMLRRYMETADKENDAVANRGIMFAKIVVEITKKYSKDDLKDIIDKLANKIGSDPQKAMALLYLDYGANLLAMAGTQISNPYFAEEVWDPLSDELNKNNSDPEKQNSFVNVVVMAFANSDLEKLKKAYYDYLSGRITLQKLKEVQNGGNLYSYIGGASNPPDYITQTKEWYEFFANGASNKLEREVAFYKDAVTKDIKLFIDKFYDTWIDDMKELAGFGYLENESDPDYARALELFMKFGMNLFLAPNFH